MEEGSWEASKAFADGLLAYVPSSESIFNYANTQYESVANLLNRPNEDDCPTLPEDSSPVKTEAQAKEVLESYSAPLPEFSKGTRVSIASRNNPYDFILPFTRGTFVETTSGEVDLDESEITVDGYKIKEHEEDDDDIAFFFPKDAVTLTPVKGGRRKQRRKTLRRKK